MRSDDNQTDDGNSEMKTHNEGIPLEPCKVKLMIVELDGEVQIEGRLDEKEHDRR